MRNLNWEYSFLSMGMKAEWETQVETQLAPRKLVSATDAQYCIQGAPFVLHRTCSVWCIFVNSTKQNKTSIGWPQVPWEISLYKTTTQNPGPQYVYQRDKNTGSPPIPYWTMAGIFFKGQGLLLFLFLQHNTWNKTKKKAGYFNAIFTFGSKYTRQNADVDLGREGIEVFHSDWAPFHWVSPGRKRQVHHRS